QRAGAACSFDSECPKASPEDDPHCVCDGLFSPAQEYRFDGSQIVATSKFFRSASDRVSLRLAYDTTGALWTAAIPGPVPSGGTARLQLYPRSGDGHSYSAADPSGAAIVPPDEDTLTVPWEGIYAPEAIQSSNAMYITTPIRLQRAQQAFGQWVKD